MGVWLITLAVFHGSFMGWTLGQVIPYIINKTKAHLVLLTGFVCMSSKLKVFIAVILKLSQSAENLYGTITKA